MVDPTMATRFFEIGATLEADFPQYTAQSSKQDGGEPQAWPDELVLGVILYATQLAILPWIDDKSQCLVNMPEIVYQAHLAEIQARTFSEPSGDPDVMDVVANLITEYHALHTSHLFDPFYFDRLDGTREELAQIMLGLRRLRGDEAYWHEIRIPDNYQDYLAWAAKSSPQAEPKPEVAYAYSGGDIARLARRWGPVVGVVGAVAFLVACGGDSESAMVVETPVQESGGLIGDVTVEVVPTVTVEDLATATAPAEASPTLPATAEPEANATPTAETVNIGGGYTLEDLTAEQITSANEWLALLFEAGVISSTGEWNLVPHESGIFCIEGPAIDVADQPGEGQISDTLIVQDSELAVGYRIDRANEFVLAGISDAQALTISADGMTLALNGAGEIVGMRLSYRQAGTGITTAELVPYFEAVAFEHDGESWLAYDSEGNVLASFNAGNGVWVEEVAEVVASGPVERLVEAGHVSTSVSENYSSPQPVELVITDQDEFERMYFGTALDLIVQAIDIYNRAANSGNALNQRIQIGDDPVFLEYVAIWNGAGEGADDQTRRDALVDKILVDGSMMVPYPKWDVEQPAQLTRSNPDKIVVGLQRIPLQLGIRLMDRDRTTNYAPDYVPADFGMEQFDNSLFWHSAGPFYRFDPETGNFEVWVGLNAINSDAGSRTNQALLYPFWLSRQLLEDPRLIVTVNYVQTAFYEYWWSNPEYPIRVQSADVD